ncbi:MAG: molybdenum cofactor biosynthesis protein MoaE [Roseibacillus sp.]|nr:molybdenum cofactor biosynthesis protein MoaE [Roseibacillus sp.]
MRFEVTDQPIPPDALYQEVLEDSDGAVVTFCGVVRDHSGEKRTDHLEYEAYPAMAEKKMAEIGEEIRQRWELGDLAILHRTGRLEIGEISVLIAVASPHRGDGFAACRYAIDRLKEIVPIWKKEVTPEGAYWVEGPTAAPVT